METLGERIVRLRTDKAITRGDLGQRVGVSNVTVHYWETNRNAPSLHRIASLARVLGVSAEYILTGREATALASLRAAIARRDSRDGGEGRMTLPFLKPCPFCGHKNLIIDSFSGERPYAVSCETAECMAIGPEGRSHDEAVRSWNAELKRS